MIVLVDSHRDQIGGFGRFAIIGSLLETWLF